MDKITFESGFEFKPNNIGNITKYRYGEYQYETGNSVPYVMLHWHEYYEVELIISGCATDIINGTSYTAAHGFFTILSPNDFHKIIFDPNNNTLILKLYFLPQYLPEESIAAFSTIDFPVIAEYSNADYDVIAGLFSNLKEIYYNNTYPLKLKTFFLRHAAESILCFAFNNQQSYKSHGKQHSTSKPIMEAINYINNHINEPLTVSEIANKIYLSPNYFCRLFKKCTSMSVSEYIVECRMNNAYYMLYSTNLPVSEIALQNGYRSSSLFYRHFSMYFNMPPLKVRNQN